MRGDIHDNKIIRSLWRDSHTEIFFDLLEIGFHCVSVCLSPFVPVLYVFLFICRVITLLFSGLVQSLNLNSLLFFFPTCFSSLLIIFSLMTCSWSFFPFSLMWWCLPPHAVRRKRFRGCVTVCPSTISLHSSHLTILMGFAPVLHCGRAYCALTLCIFTLWLTYI